LPPITTYLIDYNLERTFILYFSLSIPEVLVTSQANKNLFSRVERPERRGRAFTAFSVARSDFAVTANLIKDLFTNKS